jgi:hypothetical protein
MNEEINLDIDSHKDWYYCSVCFKDVYSAKIRWIDFLVFSKNRKYANSVAQKVGHAKKWRDERVEEIHLYRNNYKRDARTLIRDNKFYY